MSDMANDRDKDKDQQDEPQVPEREDESEWFQRSIDPDKERK